MRSPVETQPVDWCVFTWPCWRATSSSRRVRLAKASRSATYNIRVVIAIDDEFAARDVKRDADVEPAAQWLL
jgi:hypothetical protein